MTKLREEIARIVDRKRQLNEEADIEEREW